MKAIGIGIVGLVAFVLIFGNTDAESSSGAWRDQGYSSYSECKNSSATLLLAVQYKMKYPNVSDNSITHTLCN